MNNCLNYRSSASPESGLGTSHTSLHGSGQETNEQLLNEDMYYEVEPLQPLGICKALYAFDGKNLRSKKNSLYFDTYSPNNQVVYFKH